MSKSLGNFTTVADMRKSATDEVIRMALLWSHYRGELDWTQKLMHEVHQRIWHWTSVAADEEAGAPSPEFVEALCDDLNTPRARAEMDRLAKLGDGPALKACADLIGLPLVRRHVHVVAEPGRLVFTGPQAVATAERRAAPDGAEKIEALLAERAAARKANDFARADAIRDAIAAAGVIVKDTPQGAEWELGPDFDPSKLEDVA